MNTSDSSGLHNVKKILLMRHAKSSWKDHKLDDFERPLAKRGRGDIQEMARWLLEHELAPDLIIASSARRTHETACGMLYHLQSQSTLLKEDKRLYLSDPQMHLHILEDHLGSAKTLMLVGHNPALDKLLLHLASQKPTYNASGKLMTTGAVAVLELKENVQQLVTSCCNILQLQRPKEIAG